MQLYTCLIFILAYGFSKASAGTNNEPVTYYLHPVYGNDANSGRSKQFPLRSLAAIEKIKLHPGDTIVLAAGQTFYGSLRIIQQSGDAMHPVSVLSAPVAADDKNIPATIDFKSNLYGILLEDASNIEVLNIHLTANGGKTEIAHDPDPMRCGVMVRNLHLPMMQHIQLKALDISDVYFEEPGYIRPSGEVRSANGTQKYGWGIRIISPIRRDSLKDIEVSHCRISNVSHTGIKLTGADQNMSQIKLIYNTLANTGGPGIQMSNVQSVYVAFNRIDHSGSTADSRNWGRGSGLWTWGSRDVLIEKNTFQYANGPGDSDGAHIDFNCSNIILQYNLSAHNAGGFCEILGNTFNCVYRFNVSINDGYRVKGRNGAFQEGKTLWLSGYQGDHQKRKGPANTYIYNNTIYADSTIFPKLAFDNTSKDVLIANNIFCTANPFQLVPGDQYKPDSIGNTPIKTMVVSHNLFSGPGFWPADLRTENLKAFFADPQFSNPGGMRLQDYIPRSAILLRANGVLPDKDWFSNKNSFQLPPIEFDILGNPIKNLPPIGAIVPAQL